MERRYEALFILNTSGKEENSKELVEKTEKEIQLAGGKIFKVERMDKRPFARVAHQLDAGYYVNIGFEMMPEKLAAFREKLKLDKDVFRVMFVKKNSNEPAPRRSQEAEKMVAAG